jgi:hypothetical protein
MNAGIAMVKEPLRDVVLLAFLRQAPKPAVQLAVL